jgi:ABC-type Fe3+/spermidine/putrescine transport system ATPase subunit
VKLDQGTTVAARLEGLSTGERCHAVVRPEKLRIDLAGAAAANGRPRVEGVVESSLYLGTATQIAVDLGGGTRMTVLVPNADEELRQRLPGGGARVALSWEPEHMHLVRESRNTVDGEDPEAGPSATELQTTRRG